MLAPITARRRDAFTIVELLVVISIIILLLAFLLVGLSAVRSQGVMAKSMKRLQQVGHWMTLYSGEHRDTILPSQFDYSGNGYPGKVRSIFTAGVGTPFAGTWSDILWTTYAEINVPEAVAEIGHNFEFDSPDKALHEYLGGDFDDPLRSAAANTRDTPDVPEDSLALPFGAGARERGLPGYFAANNFFNTVGVGGQFYGLGQIKLPAKSLYLIDSFAGEVIEDDCPAWAFNNGDPAAGEPPTGQVDFRYSGEAIILLLDGHVTSAGQWQNLDELENDRRIRVRNLNSHTPPTPCP
jgi:type II secretory pathway pseudopilin PulG